MNVNHLGIGSRVSFADTSGTGCSAHFQDTGIVTGIENRGFDPACTVRLDRNGQEVRCSLRRWHLVIKDAEVVVPVSTSGLMDKLNEAIEAQKVEIADAKATYRAAQRKLSQMQAAKTLIEGL